MESGPVIVDTDTLSEICRGNLRIRERADAYLHRFGRLTLTSITVFERLRAYHLAIAGGQPFERQRQAFEALLSASVVLPFDEDAARVAARIWSSVARKDRRHLGDILIAAVAVSRQLPLVTRNRRDFDRLRAGSGLELGLLDWMDGGRRRAR